MWYTNKQLESWQHSWLEWVPRKQMVVMQEECSPLLGIRLFWYVPKMEIELTGTRVTKTGYIATTCQLEYFKHTSVMNSLDLLDFLPHSQSTFLEKDCPSDGWKNWGLKVSITEDDFPGSSDGKESACNAGDLGSIPQLGRSPGEGNWLPTPAFLLGEFHGQRILVDYSPWSPPWLSQTWLSDWHTHIHTYSLNIGSSLRSGL